jgi:hypothetical protein
MSQRERARTGNARGKGGQELIRVFRLPPEPTDDGEVDALGETGLTPALEGQATDETKTKPSGAAELLNLQRSTKDGVHGDGRR